MNKTAIKNFAIWARRKLISDITYKAGMLGITESGIAQPLPQSTRDLQFFDIGTKDYAEVSGIAIAQRDGLAKAIRAKEQGSDYKTAFRNVIEEVAYTWFNRLIAVRFMEVNDYLPSHIRVLSSENEGKLEPDFVTTPFDTDLPFTPYEKDLVFQLKDNNKLDELFRMLFIKQCNKLSEILPGLFEQISDYTELLLNISFTDKDGIVYHLTHDISEDEFNVEKEGQVEIIGWMYQYYNTEPKDEVFALLKKNVKITKERIPAATQLFTPDWIVRYMVENSLGRLWVEGHPNEQLKTNWKYYLEEAEQEPDVVEQLNKIREEYAQLSPTDIKVIDPCMGSGHILVYAFDVLLQIYTSQGYIEREAAKSILINNLYGIDIDTRAYQLAYFAVMMKARHYNRRIFQENITPNLISIKNPADVSKSVLKRLGELEPLGLRLVEDFEDAEEYGSILQVNYTEDELEKLEQKLEEIDRMADYGNLLVQMESAECCNLLWPLIKQARLLSQKYDVVVTNPPYMGGNGMNPNLSRFIKEKYKGWHIDLYSCFMAQAIKMLKPDGYSGFMTSYTWMFLNTFSEARMQLLNKTYIQSLVQPEYHSFFAEAFVPVCTFVFRNNTNNYNGVFVRLEQFYGADLQEKKYREAVDNQHACNYIYNRPKRMFSLIPGNPIAYWLSESVLAAFTNGTPLGSVAEPRQGLATADNERFLRMWSEVMFTRIGFGFSNGEIAKKSGKRWFPYCKGGAYRKWAGNTEYLVNWENDGKELRGYKGSVIRNQNYYFKTGMTWGSLTVSDISFRYVEHGFLFDSKGPICFAKDLSNEKYLLGLVNSKVAMLFLSVLAPTMDYSQGPVSKIPYYSSLRKQEINELVDHCISISKEDWDSFEASWNFKRHPLVEDCHNYYDRYPLNRSFQEHCNSVSLISKLYERWKSECDDHFFQLKYNEEKLNSIFIDIYGFQDELTPEVLEKDVTVRKADLSREIRSLISYAVGCMFGRYSLDISGLVFAGGEWDNSRYSSFIPDADNCIPITDEEYFTDDIVGRFVEFVKVVYGEATLEENLDFVAAALENKGNTSREVIRNYFLNDFYKDHLKIYQKRPIYWMFDSGKHNGFKALAYMHRWNADTVGNLRIEYLHKMQTVYEHEIDTCQEMIDHGTGHDVAVATKRKEKLVKQLKECKDYDALVAHIAFSKIDIDLDDGVKVNYRKVQTGADGKFCEILANSKDIMAKEK